MKVFILKNGYNLSTYIKAVTSVNAEPVYESDISLASQCDALLLTGGGDIYPKLYGKNTSFCKNISCETDAKELFLTRIFAIEGKKIIGICKGMQIINIFFGGTLKRDIGGHKSDNYERFHVLSAVKNSYLARLYGENILVNTSHHQAVNTIGKGLKIDATNLCDGVIEAVSHDNLPIYAVQFHPEKMNREFSDRFFRYLIYC